MERMPSSEAIFSFTGLQIAFSVIETPPMEGWQITTYQDPCEVKFNINNSLTIILLLKFYFLDTQGRC